MQPQILPNYPKNKIMSVVSGFIKCVDRIKVAHKYTIMSNYIHIIFKNKNTINPLHYTSYFDKIIINI